MWFDPEELAAHDLRGGDVIIVEGGAGFGRSAVLRQDRTGWGFQNSILRFRPHIDRADGRFVDYALQSAVHAGQVAAACNTATIPHFTADKVAAMTVPAPGVATQTAIADYLDRETAQIDALIEKQQDLISALHERQAAFGESVLVARHDDTRAGVSRLLRNKHLLRERSDVSSDGSEEMLSVSHITGVTPRSEKSVTMFEAESHDGYRLVKRSDLVINTMWAWMGALGISKYEGMVSPAYGVYMWLKPAEVDVRYFDWLYRSKAYVDLITVHSRGLWSSRLRLYPESFLRLPVSVPSLVVQKQMADILEAQSARSADLAQKAQRSIELAEERRSAIITAAVTGQIDVRDAA